VVTLVEGVRGLRLLRGGGQCLRGLHSGGQCPAEVADLTDSSRGTGLLQLPRRRSRLALRRLDAGLRRGERLLQTVLSHASAPLVVARQARRQNSSRPGGAADRDAEAVVAACGRPAARW
jgi:hypothetical protein